jgi:hypothetical protein
LKKLTDREIVRIHDMRRMGVGPFEIARELRVSPNAITAHIHGDVTYPPSVQRKISLSSPLVSDGWLCRRNAAPWLPGHPSPAKMRVLMTTTSWMGKSHQPPIKSKMVKGRRVTRIEWLADYVKANFPSGIWIRVETLRVYSGSNADLAEPPQVLGRRLFGYPAAVATRLAMASGSTLELPSPLLHRAVQIERQVGMALV